MQLSEDELVARVFRVLGDSTRLRMLELLIEAGELTQTQLVERIGVRQPRASDHLSCLVWCGLVTRSKHGRSMRYRIAAPQAEPLVRLVRELLVARGQGAAPSPELPAPDPPRVG